jgi:hypothetical protein
MLPFIVGIGIVAASAVAASKDKNKAKSKPSRLTEKGVRRLPTAYALPQPVSVILANKIAEQERIIRELSLLYVVLADRINTLEKENTYKVTIH